MGNEESRLGEQHYLKTIAYATVTSRST